MADEKKDKKTKRPTALKRDIQNEKRRMENRSFKSKVKTAIRTYEKTVSEKDESVSKEQLKKLYSLLDNGVKKGIYKLNKASRFKSKLSGKI